jgi:hypothetical protein
MNTVSWASPLVGAKATHAPGLNMAGSTAWLAGAAGT